MSRGRATAGAVLAAALIVATGGTAAAHQSAVKYLDLDVRGTVVAIELRLVPSDLTRPLGLADDATPTVDQALAGADRATPYVVGWLAVRAGAAPCPASAPTMTRAAADPRFLAVTWTATCKASVDHLVLDLAGFFAVDRIHELLVHLTSPDADPYDATIGIADSPFSLALGDAAPTSGFGWIMSGVTAVIGDRDRLAFVLALVVVIAIARRSDGQWGLRPTTAAVRTAAIVVGAFALAHAAAVIAMSLGWVAPPPRFFAAMIAVSAGYVAIENIVAPDGRRRDLVALGFGLIHGLGFGAGLDPAPSWAAALAPLDLGVAVAQLATAGIGLTACSLVARAVGPQAYRNRVVPAISVGIAVLAAISLVGL